MLNLRVIRHNLTEIFTEGEMFDVDKNESICDTLEDKIRDINGDGKLEGPDEQKVYGKTAIPYGRYSIKVTWSPAFQREMVLVRNVPHFSGIRLHWGRTAEQSQGCVLVGEKDGDGTLKNIGMTDKLVEMLKGHGNEGILEIV